MIVTIDGPAAAGKGTLAAKLAEKFGFACFDTGMIYRAVGLEMVLSGADLNDETAAKEYAENLSFPRMQELAKHSDFRSNVGSEAASKAAAMPKVRQALLKMQQDFAKKPVFADGSPARGAVYDGRDTGTVVCPDADLKLFVTALPQVRAERRFKEFVQKGLKVSFEEVLAQTIARDERDMNRAMAPMRPADDAIIIDTSEMSIEEVLEKVSNLVEKRLEK
ncbi:MAG: (d)CMP kinase [Alphaproteobacteria bacterium]|nr:(d)CMP kinase [Alphaproteobacteria bacterium]